MRPPVVGWGVLLRDLKTPAIVTLCHNARGGSSDLQISLVLSFFLLCTQVKFIVQYVVVKERNPRSDPRGLR